MCRQIENESIRGEERCRKKKETKKETENKGIKGQAKVKGVKQSTIVKGMFLNIAPRYILITIHIITLQAKKTVLLWQAIVHTCADNPSRRV